MALRALSVIRQGQEHGDLRGRRNIFLGRCLLVMSASRMSNGSATFFLDDFDADGVTAFFVEDFAEQTFHDFNGELLAGERGVGGDAG